MLQSERSRRSQAAKEIILETEAEARIALTGNLTASRVVTFGSVASQAWQPGDTVFIELPTHTGGGDTVTVENIATTVLCTWPALLANGGMFVFDGVDFHATIPGVSTT